VLRVTNVPIKPLVVAVVAAALAVVGATAQQAAKQAESPAEEQPELHLSSIMAQQQMRHIKLWFAGDVGNWPLAEYELGAFKDGFDDIGKLVGDDIVTQHVGGAMSALEKSVDAKDHAAFVVAFDRLTAGCNECHRALDHAFIAIQRPTLSPYSNQNFSPQK
jgi:hypothetical protein